MHLYQIKNNYEKDMCVFFQSSVGNLDSSLNIVCSIKQEEVHSIPRSQALLSGGQISRRLAPPGTCTRPCPSAPLPCWSYLRGKVTSQGPRLTKTLRFYHKIVEHIPSLPPPHHTNRALTPQWVTAELQG